MRLVYCSNFFLFLFWGVKTENVNYSGAYASMGVDNSVRFEQFRNNFKVEIMRLEEDELEFDMIGIDPSLANAFRRILIAEVRFVFLWFKVSELNL